MDVDPVVRADRNASRDADVRVMNDVRVWVRQSDVNRFLAAERLIAEAEKVKAQVRGEAAQRPRSSPAFSAGLGPCGGDLPPCHVKARESGGSYTAYNPGGCGGRSCGGAWQFDPRTWAGYGGYPEAQMAPPAVQDARARDLWAGGSGCGHWAACG